MVATRSKLQLVYFNSIKVRLKLTGGAGIVSSLIGFQFHKGTIETCYLQSYLCNCLRISIP